MHKYVVHIQRVGPSMLFLFYLCPTFSIGSKIAYSVKSNKKAGNWELGSKPPPHPGPAAQAAGQWVTGKKPVRKEKSLPACRRASLTFYRREFHSLETVTGKALSCVLPKQRGRTDGMVSPMILKPRQAHKCGLSSSLSPSHWELYTPKLAFGIVPRSGQKVNCLW